MLGGYDFGNDAYFSSLRIGLNHQSRGEVSLASADPEDAPLINLNLMTHPFDRRVMIEGARTILRYINAPKLSKYLKHHLFVPASDSEKDIMVGTRH